VISGLIRGLIRWMIAGLMVVVTLLGHDPRG
jgi:hypothetical protein